MQEVRLPKTYASVDIERIVGLGWTFGHGKRGRLRELVAGADHKGVECVLWKNRWGGTAVNIGGGGHRRGALASRGIFHCHLNVDICAGGFSDGVAQKLAVILE